MRARRSGRGARPNGHSQITRADAVGGGGVRVGMLTSLRVTNGYSICGGPTPAQFLPLNIARDARSLADTRGRLSGAGRKRAFGSRRPTVTPIGEANYRNPRRCGAKYKHRTDVQRYRIGRTGFCGKRAFRAERNPGNWATLIIAHGASMKAIGANYKRYTASLRYRGRPTCVCAKKGVRFPATKSTADGRR